MIAAMSKTLRMGFFLTVALAVAGWGVYYSFFLDHQEYTAVPLERINLGTDASLLSASIWVANRRGYFREAGLELVITEFQSGRMALTAMLRGESLDVVTVATTAIVQSTFERKDIRILAALAESQADDAVIGNRDRGISRVADLVGKKVGLPQGTSAHFLFELVLVENGIDPSQVDIVNLPPPELPAALADHRADAISIWEPYANRARALLKDKTIELSLRGTHRSTLNLVALQGFADRHQSAIVKFLKAMDRANHFIDEHREEAYAIFADKVKLENSVIAKLLPNYNYRLSLDQLLILDLEGQARWALKSKHAYNATPPNYLELISPEPLRGAKPEAVTLVTPQTGK